MPLCIGQRCVQAAASTSSRVGAPVPTLRSNRAARSVRVGLTGGAAGEKALFGEDFGARDPYAAEIESNFGEKVLGNYNTDHIIK
jgi:4a-hydroxytetrahydrobiopterin dehydratase